MNRMICNSHPVEYVDVNCDGRFMKKLKFSEAAQLCGTEMNKNHTIIEKWPFRLKLRPGQPGAQEEFDRMLGGGVSGKERYVEWKRTYDDEDIIEDN